MKMIGTCLFAAAGRAEARAAPPRHPDVEHQARIGPSERIGIQKIRRTKIAAEADRPQQALSRTAETRDRHRSRLGRFGIPDPRQRDDFFRLG
jgi:hypothetical protein